mmetsp:Transcript_25737/g.45205  ORF Transcript_25737/g.45205 Transcript_25737/m.45205 type:complete len:879 (+) Transcript_25737:2136-4772(+)
MGAQVTHIKAFDMVLKLNRVRISQREEYSRYSVSIIDPYNSVMDFVAPTRYSPGIASQKLHRCRKFANSSNIPTCYTTNSSKEEAVLEHVKDYERQFMLTYESDRQLLLHPKNECGVEKFICTTVRPTKMPFLELYDWNICSEFVAGFIEYEELDPPNDFPKIVPSPNNVIAWQHGDCVDLSILLSSLLIGAGYDAYCVLGWASRTITTCDQSKMPFPLINHEVTIGDEDEDLQEDSEEDEKYRLPVKPPPISVFEKKIKEEIEEETRKQWEREHTIDDDTPETTAPDPWFGNRLHCWVLIKEGKREVPETFFLEPTTGRRYPLDNDMYEAVEFMWNNSNFWINMRPSLPLNELNFDDLNMPNWEFVMLDPNSLESKREEAGEDDEANIAALAVNEIGEDGLYKELPQVLDLPPPWPPKLKVDRDVFAQRCPRGERTVLYEKWKQDVYADYSQVDGLVARSTIYFDYRRLLINEIRCYFRHRRDKLVMRRRFPYEFKTVEDYAPRKSHSWKQVVEVDGRYRIITYYPTRNHDCLIKREEVFGKKTKEYYRNRTDFMTFRSWKVDTKESKTTRDYIVEDFNLGRDVLITKMTQKFAKNPYAARGKKIAKITYDIEKGVVRIEYHYEPGSIIREVKEEQRERFLTLGKMGENQDKEMQDEAYQQWLQFLFEMEKDCHNGIRTQVTSAKEDIDKRRKREEAVAGLKGSNDISAALNIVIKKTIYDKAREKNKEIIDIKAEDKIQESSVVDYLTPVLREKKMENRDLEPKEAWEVKNTVMMRLKERLVRRMDIIQKSLERENTQMQAEINLFKRKGDQVTQEETAAYEAMIAQFNFRIDILEHRAALHEEMSMEKYADMEMQLNKEPILAPMHGYDPSKDKA